MAQLPCCGLHDFLNSRAKCICEAICRNKDGFQLFFAETMGCSCSSDYSDTDWIENLDEICEHCNCPIPPQSCNQVGVHSSRSVNTWYFTDYICRECVKYFCVNLDFILKTFFLFFPVSSTSISWFLTHHSIRLLHHRYQVIKTSTKPKYFIQIP